MESKILRHSGKQLLPFSTAFLKQVCGEDAQKRMIIEIGSELIKRRKEGNILFNDALNTFYLRLYGVRHMVKDHSDSKRGNSLPPRLTARVLLYAPSHSLCYTSCGALAGMRNSSMGPPHEGSIRRPIAP